MIGRRRAPGRRGAVLACLASATTALVSACAQGKPTTIVSGAAPAPTTTGPAPAGTRTIDGAVVSTQYGDIQVAVTLANGRISDVQPITLPTDRPRSAEISQQAAPLLRQESLQAQSGSINVLSGATYTSEAWAQSLSAALSAAQ